uniref:Uncharacterized protein n=1 Tax=Plectus sambesii TaxID=2011161 RepID=A0A914WP32_9BILA
MTGKRKSSSRNPKTVKRSKLQTNSIKKSAINEEEKVQLEFMVVEKIASMTELKFNSDFCQELVSLSFANALRSSYSKKKLTLSFALSAEDAEYAYSVKGYPGIFVLFISGYTRQSKEKIKIDDDNLGQAAQQIFARFRRIHLKEQEVINSDNAAGSLTDALNSVHDVTIKTLHITFCYRNLIESFELIMKLSRNLKNLNLHILDPSVLDVEWSENFWQTVASCTELVWLNVEFDYDRCVEDNLLETSDAILVPISNCLKQLKIKHFRTNLQE